MKRYLAFLLALVMLVSAFGGANVFAADGANADEQLVVCSKSGSQRTLHVGDTVTYSYALRLGAVYDLDRVLADVLYDSECLELTSWEFPNFSGAVTTSSKPGDFHFEKGVITNGDQFHNSILTVVTCTFTVKRGGTTYIRTVPEHLEAEGGSNNDVELVVGYLPTTSGSAKYSSYDYLGDDKPNASTTKLNTSSDVVWFYITDSTTGEPVPAGLTFRLSGATDSGETFERTATTDSYGYLCFGTVPFGSYYVQCISDTAAGETYFVEDSAVTVLNVANGKLAIDNAMQAHTVAADSLLTLEVTIKWSGEEISAGETYTKERPKSLYLELHSGSTAYAQRYVSSDTKSVTFDRLPQSDEAGSPISYELAVPAVEHYDAVVTRTESGFAVEFIYKNDHAWETTRKDPTCTESGYIESTCTDCGATNYTTLPALGHDYAISGTPASCTEHGYQVAVCKRCGVRYVEQTEPLGHNWSEWTITKDATATEDGERVRTCLRCGETETQLMPGPNHEHTYVVTKIPATCTEPGYVDVRCACGDGDRYEDKSAPALGHDYTGDSSIINIQSPTCTEDGIKQYTCTRCGEIHDEILPKLGHNWELIAGSEIPATCEKTGSKEYKCGNCGDTKTVTEPSLGHAWGEWIVDTPATTTAEGSKHRVCTRCGKEQTETIPKLDHTHEYSIPVVTEPTCTEQGYTTYQCSCGAGVVDEDSYQPALGHNWEEVFRQPATERSQGVVQYQCTRCGLYRYETLPKLPSSWSNPFWDVSKEDWFYDAVRYVAQNGFMTGRSQTRFAPNDSMSRAMLVTVLYRMEGEPKFDGMFNPFEDVPEGTWYSDAVAWAATLQIVNGMSETEFAPEEDVTREQMVTIFYRYAQFKGYDTSASAPLSFPDAGEAMGYALPALSWAVATGLISGVGTSEGSMLQPQGTATRAQAATIIMRFDQWRLSASGG